MVSDHEIIAAVLKQWMLVRRGERSLASAGEACFRELYELGRRQPDDPGKPADVND